MKRIIIALLIACMLIGVLSACGSGAKAADAKTDSTTQAEAKNTDNPDDTGKAAEEGGSSGSIYTTPGDELTDYLNALTKPEEEYINSITGIEASDMETMGAQMTIAFPNVAVLSLPMYDILSVEDLPREEGKMMLSGMDAVREKSGKEIKFSAGRTYTEDTETYKSGDKISEKGSLDMQTNTLTIELKIESGGKVINRTVFESVILKDGTCLIQYLNAANLMDGSKVSTNAVFKRYNKGEYTAVVAGFDGKTDFSYDSIAGKGDIQSEEMAKNYKVTGKFTVRDGKVEFTK